MSHFTLHSTNGATVTLAWTPAGYDAVAWMGDTRAALIDNVGDSRSLWQAACWLAGQLGYGGEDDLGEVLSRFVLDETREDIGSGAAGEIADLLQKLVEVRR